MADKWPAANGNWSTAANWNGGTLPQPGDDVYADGKTVTIDQDINVASIRTDQRSGGTAGGSFPIAAGTTTRTIAANIIAGTTTCLTISIDCTVTINGNVTGGTASASTTGILTSGGTSIFVNINGNITAGSAGAAIRTPSGRTTFTIVGNATNTATVPATVGVSSSLSLILTGAIISVGSGSTVINGVGGGLVLNLTQPLTKQNSVNVSAGAAIINGNIDGSTEIGAIVTVQNAGTLTVNGNLTGGTANSAAYAVSVLVGNLYIRGNVTGKLAPAINTSNSVSARSSVLIIEGTVTGGNTVTGFGVLNQGVNNVYVYGTTVDNTAVAVSNTSTGTTIVTEVVEEITMACVEMLNVTEDDISEVQEITGNFDFQASTPEGGTYYLYRALGASADSEKRADFQLFKTFTGPANLPIENIGTNRFKVQLVDTKGVNDKIVTVNIQD